MAKPALLMVNDNADTLAALERDLGRRLGADYQVVAVDSPADGLGILERLAAAGDEVALLLADQWLPGMTGIQLLSRAHAVHPAAKRVLLITYDDVAAGVAGLQAMALGQLDHWLNTPFGPPELQLYPAVSEQLGQWARATVSAGSQPEWVPQVHRRGPPDVCGAPVASRRRAARGRQARPGQDPPCGPASATAGACGPRRPRRR
jgi:CheY-like chemotaxis protein